MYIDLFLTSLFSMIFIKGSVYFIRLNRTSEKLAENNRNNKIALESNIEIYVL